MDRKVKFGNNVMTKRIQSGMTRQELATKLGMSWIGIWRIEKGQRGTSLERLPQLAGILGTTVGELLGDPEE
jgi:transcriptional regulator with XRE-family HTH domain